MTHYDAVLLVSFGGPEGPDDVLPFMENVTRGRGIPRERLITVSEHYQLFGGVSPINAQNRALLAALHHELDHRGISLPIFWGNRNWHPMLADTIAEMADAGITRALAIVTSAYSSYSGCRQYLDDIERARVAVGDRSPVIDKVRAYFNHPGFIEPLLDNIAAATIELDALGAAPDSAILCTAHSIPLSMATSSPYVEQLREVQRMVAEANPTRPVDLVFQSRSGPPDQPWLEPDVNDAMRALAERGANGLVLAPIGFISDHMEVVYDLDTQARDTARELGLSMTRAATVGTDPRFVTALGELIHDRLTDSVPRTIGLVPARPDVCPSSCCPAPARPAPARPAP